MISSWKGLCVTLWVIGICVNTPLNVGIVSYEKIGMDPLKRNLTDMTFSMIISIGAIMTLTISNSLLLWAELVSPLGKPMALAYAFLNNVRSNIILLCLLEIMGMKVLACKIWKSIPPINEDYFAWFFRLLNLALGCFYGLVMVMVNNRPFQDSRLLGHSISEPMPMNYDLTLGLAIFTLICFSLLVLDWVQARIKKNSAVHESGNAQGLAFHVNNTARNEEVLTKSLIVGVILMMAVASIIPSLIRTGVVKIEEDQVREHFIVATMFNNIVITLAIPCLVYLKNKGLRKYIKEALRSMF